MFDRSATKRAGSVGGTSGNTARAPSTRRACTRRPHATNSDTNGAAPEASFGKAASRLDGLTNRCSECHKASRRSVSPEERRSEWRRKRYGLTGEAFDALLASQGGVCAICLTPDPGVNGWAVDHDHSCCAGNMTCSRCVRGVLCAPCNRALGVFQDDVARLARAIDYLT